MVMKYALKKELEKKHFNSLVIREKMPLFRNF